MTQTLTTETIKLWRINAEITLGETDELDPENNAAKAILALTEELLANREAETQIYQIWDDGRWYDAEEPIWRETYNEACKSQFRIVYTAPPAPAAATPVYWEMRYWNSGHGCFHDWGRITEEQHAELSVKHAADNDYDFRVLYTEAPAPAVPETQHSSVIAEQLANVLSGMEVTGHQMAVIGCAVDRLNKVTEILQQKPAALIDPGSLDYQSAKELFNYLMNEEEINATVNGWNACRAAMRAAAPEGGSEK